MPTKTKPAPLTLKALDARLRVLEANNAALGASRDLALASLAVMEDHQRMCAGSIRDRLRWLLTGRL